MHALGGFMALCPPVFAPDGSAIYMATGSVIVALSLTTLSLLQVIPTPKRQIVKLSFLYASDSQLLILSRHKFSIYNTRTGSFSLEVSLPEVRDAKSKEEAAILGQDSELLSFVQCEKSDCFVFLLETKASKDRTYFLISYSLSAGWSESNRAVFDLSKAVSLTPPPLTPEKYTLHRTTRGLIASGGIIYVAIDYTIFFARFTPSKSGAAQELPAKFSLMEHDACITQLVPFNYRTSHGFIMGDLYGAFYRFEGIPVASTVAESKHIKFHWNKRGINALAVANVTTATPQILIGGEETILVNLSVLDYVPQFGPSVIGPIRYIACPQASVFSPSSITYFQTACIVTATNTIYLVDIASHVIIAQRHGIVSPSRNLRYTPKETPGIFVYSENEATSVLTDGSPGDVQLLHGIENLPSSAFLPKKATTILTLMQRNKIYSRSESSDPPHVLHFAALANGSLLVAVTGLKLMQGVHQEEVLYLYGGDGGFDNAKCLAQIFRPHSTPIRLLAPLIAVQDCDLFLTVSQLEAKVFSYINDGLVEIFNWDICDGFEDKPIMVEAAGISRDGLHFCAITGDLELNKEHCELKIYKILYSTTERSGNDHRLPVGIQLLEEFDLLKYSDNNNKHRGRRATCSVSNTSVCVSSSMGTFYYRFQEGVEQLHKKKSDLSGKGPLAINLPVMYQVFLSPHCDDNDCHYISGIGDDKGFVFKLKDGAVKEQVLVFEKRHKRDRICGLDCSSDGHVYALVSTRATGRQLLCVLGKHAKHDLQVEECPPNSKGMSPILNTAHTSTEKMVLPVGDSLPREFSEEPSHRVTEYGARLRGALDALF